MNQHPNLRLTPSNSPFYKTVTPKSPSKTNKNVEEAGLRLRKVIGTTTAAVNGFDCLPAARKFAYTAGAAAVVATVHDDLTTTQRFFRARPNVLPGSKDSNGYFPITPTPTEVRNRNLGSLRDSTLASSPVGTLGRDWSDSPTGKSTTAKDRIKAATSVALSPNGKWLAVGETGYKPRVLIFRVADDLPESPVAAVAEHAFGVHALAFSPDSRHLVSLGTVNDGFLFVWAIDERTGAATLYASNKCTSLTNSLAWVGRSVVTVGLRFIKVWRPDEESGNDIRTIEPATTKLRNEIKPSEFGNSILTPKHKVLAGKNSLLGDLLEANFVAVLPLSDSSAIICAESGEVCILDDQGRTQTVTVVANAGIRSSAARLEMNGDLVILGAGSQVKRLTMEELKSGSIVTSPQLTKADRRKTVMPGRVASSDDILVVATGSVGDTAVELDSRGSIRLIRRHGPGKSGKTSKTVHQLPAHEAAVLAVHPMHCSHVPNAAFFTLSGDGTIQLWDFDGASVATLAVPVDSTPDMYGFVNELKAAATLDKASIMAVGDKFGVVTILDLRTRAVLTQVRAHGAEVVDIATFERQGMDLIATAGRDRAVQIFTWKNGGLRLIQTLDEHAAALNSLLFTPDGEHLLSCSADRTIVVREAMLREEDDPTSTVFIILRTITLRASPTSMTLGAQDDTILVSTTDRFITNFNYRTGQTGFGFKCLDSDGGEAAVMSRILYAPSLNGASVIIAVGSSDKSVRLYSEVGILIARDWGHTEGITDVALIDPKTHDAVDSKTVVTAAADSTIFLWDTSSMASTLRQPQQEGDVLKEIQAARKPMPMAPPLRKVLSHSELFRSRTWRERSIDENQPSPPLDAPAGTRSTSPQRTLRKKTSRMSVAQPPRLEPAFRSSTYDGSRRKSIRQRSPSPPSPRAAMKRELMRRPSLGMSLRTKSSDNMLNGHSNVTNNTGFGSLTSSTESVCRTLRAYRKKLANSTPSDNIAPETMRELEKELKLTARVLSQKSQGKTIDEAMMARLLDQASEKIVEMLDERIKERVENGFRRGDSSPSLSTASIAEAKADALAGALEKATLDQRS